jgi:hypothetical protein
MVQNQAAVKKVFLKAGKAFNTLPPFSFCIHLNHILLDLFPKAPHSFGEEGSLLTGMIRHPSILTEVGTSWKVHRKVNTS